MSAYYETRPLDWRIERDRVELGDCVEVRSREGHAIGLGIVIESLPFEWGAHTVLVRVSLASLNPVYCELQDKWFSSPVEVHFSRKGWSPHELSDGELSKLIEVVGAMYASPSLPDLNLINATSKKR